MNSIRGNSSGILSIIGLILITSLTLSGQVKSPILNGKDKVALFAKQIEMKAASPFKDLKWQYIDPTNTDVVWVGTGEANIFRSLNAGCGVFKTTDGGKTFKSLKGPHVFQEDVTRFLLLNLKISCELKGVLMQLIRSTTILSIQVLSMAPLQELK